MKNPDHTTRRSLGTSASDATSALNCATPPPPPPPANSNLTKFAKPTLLAAASLLAASAGALQAATYYWVGGTSGNWNAANAWNTASDNSGTARTWSSPYSSDTAVINPGSTVLWNYQIGSPNLLVGSVQVDGMLSLNSTWNSVGTLFGSGTLINGGGSGGIAGAADGNDLNLYSGNSVFDGVIQDGPNTRMGITLAGSGTHTLTLTNINPYTFRTTITSHTTLFLSGQGSIANSYVIFRNGGGASKFDISGIDDDSTTVKMIGYDHSLTGRADGAIILGSKYLQIGTHGQVGTFGDFNGTGVTWGIFSASIGSSAGTDTGGIIKEGKFTFTYNPTEDQRQIRYTGETRINEGTFKLTGVNGADYSRDAMASSAGIVLSGNAADAAKFDISGMGTANTYIQTLNGGGEVVLGSKELRVGGVITSDVTTVGVSGVITGTGAGVFDGIISGAGGQLTKDGTGTLILGGANIYTGKTTISGGVLKIATTGSINSSSAIEINGGELILTQSGQISVDPTLTNGKLTLDGVDIALAAILTIGAGNSFGGSGSVGTALDVSGGTLEVAGTLTLNAAVKLDTATVHFDLSAGPGTLNLGSAPASNNDVNVTFAPELLDGPNKLTIIGVDKGDLDLWKVNNTLVSGSNYEWVDAGQATTSFSLVAIPEPSTYALLGGVGALALALLRRRRKA